MNDASPLIMRSFLMLSGCGAAVGGAMLVALAPTAIFAISEGISHEEHDGAEMDYIKHESGIKNI